ncbi:MAG: glutamyl-tRNA reductase [Acidimicrobiaceae bacterium]|nr:glutamyl-tRNA reductase [Acidimicrobiaceae bacterium]
MLEIAPKGSKRIKDCHSLSLVVIGVNNRTMPLNLFESFAVPADNLPKTLVDVKSRRHVSEAVVLSTCNRTEIYVFAEKFHGAYQDVRDFLSDLSDLPAEDFSDYLYVHYEDEAIRHLFSVTCGLDSAVVGENEIQHQVKVAWKKAQEENTCGPIINAAFRRALEVGKRVRTQTGLSKNTPSIARAVVDMAAEHLNGLQAKKVLLLGAGEMGEGMATSLYENEIGEIIFANRNLDNARKLASTSGSKAIAIEEIPKYLNEVDLFISSTAAPEALFNSEQLLNESDRKDQKNLLIIDIAIPRDIDPAVADVKGVTLLDMDNLRDFAEPSRVQRETDLVIVRKVISEETNRFLDQQSARKVAPLITEFRDSAEEIRQIELKRFEARLANLSDDQRNAIESLTQGILGKILHDPTVSLNEAAGSPRGERLADALRELFNL